jgi:uncharacterized protein
MTSNNQAIVPVAQSERIAELDVLRGVALFGVLTVNFIGFAGADTMATQAQLDALPTAAIDRWVQFLVEWLLTDKANTMFATLFGLGFYIQLTRSEGRPGFERRYARRLFWLLIFGWLNTVFLWLFDILNLYALAGFFLLAMRKWTTRTLVILGTAMALYSIQLQDWLIEMAGIPPLMPWNPYSDAAVLERQALGAAGDYGGLVAHFWRWTWSEWLVGGMIVSSGLYALGRFALGAAIGRSGLPWQVAEKLALLRRIALITIPLGLMFALLARVLATEMLQPGPGDGWKTLGQVMRAPQALVLACGYSCAVVIAFHQPRWRRFLQLFAPLGQMALTNYLAQGLLYAFVMFGVGPGLALAGKIGSTQVLACCLAFLAFQIAYSRWWLARYRFGPMEWLWRWLTYGGVMPSLRRSAIS